MMMGGVYTPTTMTMMGWDVVFFVFEEVSVGLETVFSLESSYISRN